MSELKEIALMSRAYKALVEASSLDEVQTIRNQAEATKAYAKKAKLGKELIIEASVIKLRAERRLGEMLSQIQLPRGAPGNQKTGKKQLVHSHGDSGPIPLRSLGISHSESSRTQKIAKLADDVFEKYIEDSRVSGREPTTAAVLRICKNQRTESNAPLATQTGIIDSLQPLLEQDVKFKTIYADPPWPYDNQGTRAATNGHYKTMSLKQIMAEPIPKLSESNAHLHLWVTSSFLREGIHVLDAWGFEYKSSFVWVKPQMGLGNYWRVSHEIMLLGIRGSLTFGERNYKSWIELTRQRHSEKPEEIREIIERVSPGPYLELYGRRKPKPGWTVYGK